MQKAKKYAIIVGVVVALVIIVGLTLAAIFHVLQDVLYIALFILALFMVAATLFQIYSIIMLVRTVTTVRAEIQPLIASVQETLGLVKDTARTAGHTVSTIGNTTKLTSEFALGPGVRAVSAVVAGQQVLRVFLGRGQARSKAESRREHQLAAMQVNSTEGGE